MRNGLRTRVAGGTFLLLLVVAALLSMARKVDTAPAAAPVDVTGVYSINVNNFHPGNDCDPNSAQLVITQQQGNVIEGYLAGFETQPIYNGMVIGSRAPNTNDDP